MLADFISTNTSAGRCDYCGRAFNNPQAAYLSEIAELMAAVIIDEWADPGNELPCESREGGYQGEVLDAFELLEMIGFNPRSAGLFRDAASFFGGQDWCKRDYFAATQAERHKFGWEGFCSVVKHERRYTFWSSMDDGNPPYHPDHLPPGQMLAEIGSVITRLGLIRTVAAGTRYWRVQCHPSHKPLMIPSRLTSPPVECATKPNRMSPSGIPMFYGTEDFDTAILEAARDEEDNAATGVLFEVMRPLEVLHLNSRAKAVSYFAPNGREWRQQTEFLWYFAREVSTPIYPDDRQHIEYAPTQVFTEYVRFHLCSAAGKPVDGIRYLSSRTRRPCVVLFFEQDDCLSSREGRPQSLRYVPGSDQMIPLDKPTAG
ncbi:MAG: HEPN-associated N-terminal domain-containing protein, partial [Pirellulales bacterium]